MDSLRAQIVSLQAELDSLRARYDTLLEAKNRAAERYKADYKKWRDFKRWLFRGAETDDHVKTLLQSGELDAYTSASALRMRKQLRDSAPDLDAEQADREQGSIKARLRSPLMAVDSRHRRRKSYHGESSREVLSSSPRSNKDPFLTPQSANRDDTPSVLEPKSEIPCKEESCRPTPLTEPRKGRGRYAHVPPGMGAINARFSIRRDRNDDMDFQYDAVARNRQERKHMFGTDCECCHDYYEAVGPLPAPQQPLWRTPTKRKLPHNPHESDDDKENIDEVQEHKQLISRHRHHWHGPKTPPGYWDIGFPDTQEVLDINRRAAEMHKRKFAEVESEAKNNNGRYVERVPKTP